MRIPRLVASFFPLALGLLAFVTDYAAAPAHAEVIRVTSPDDEDASNRPAPAGSLREAVEVKARPGDTIVFAVAGPVRLERLLTIPPGLTGLSIEGPGTIQSRGGRHASLSILAEAVTIRDLLLDGVDVFIGSQLDAAPQARLVGNTFRGIASVHVETARDCLIERNDFTVADRGQTVIGLDRTVGCRVSDNRIESRAKVQIDDTSSRDLVVTANRLDGGIDSSQRSGRISDNRLSGREGIWIRPADFSGSARLHVTGNTAPFIRVRRTDVEVSGNTLQPTGAPPPPVLLRIENRARQVTGDVVVRDNVLRGGRDGLSYDESPNRSAPATVADNVITGCSRHGLIASQARLARIQGNEVTNCGSGDGTGLGIWGGGDGLVVETNTITGTLGVGIDVVTPSGAVVLRANTVRGGTDAGIRLTSQEAAALLETNTVTGNGGAGVEALEDARAIVTGGVITGNGGAGVLVHPRALVRISQVAMGGNAGPGIDIFPVGVTDNAVPKEGNEDLDWPTDLTFDPITGRLLGVAAPASRVEVFAVEPPPRAGNPENGEGTAFMGAVLADSAGRFAFPASGRLQCADAMQLTLTATLLAEAPFTSEFSPNIECPATPPPPPDTDSDGDGVVNADDQCATPPGQTVNADGCAESLTLPNGTQVYCTTQQGCSDTANTGQCTDCSFASNGRVANCPAGATCRSDSAGRFLVQGGTIGTAQFTVNCPNCTFGLEGDVLCHGGAGSCDGRFTNGLPLEGCGTVACSSFIEPAVNGDNAAAVVVRKRTVNGEGDFELVALRGIASTISRIVHTANGAGDAEVRLIVAAPFGSASVEVFEFAPDDWTAEIACTGLAPVQGQFIELSLATGSTSTCTVTNTRPLVTVVAVPNGIGSPFPVVQDLLLTAQLGVGIVTPVSLPGVPANTVVAMDPPPGTLVLRSSLVNLAVTLDAGAAVLLGPERVANVSDLVNRANVTVPATFPVGIAAALADEASGFTPVSVGASNGWGIIDPETLETLHVGVDEGGGPQFGALVLRNRLGTGRDGLFTYGSLFTSVRVWDPSQEQYGIVQVGRSGGRDASHTGGDPNSPDALATAARDILGMTVIELSPSSVFVGGPVRPLASASSIPGIVQFVSAFAYDLLRLTPLGELSADSVGWVLAITDGAPGRAYLMNPRTPTAEGVLVGDVGDGPRSVRCLQSHGICAVVNFVSGTATIILWDGQSTATIAGHVAIDAGAVTGDVRADGVNVALLTSGFTSNTVTKTTLAPDGSVVSSETRAVSALCDGPAHALWLWHATKYVLSCNRSNFLERGEW